jgi:hypothetical protein
MQTNDLRTTILGTVSDLVADFLYYDRKEDESLPRGTIEKAIEDGAITVDEIVEVFRTEIEKNI